MVTLRIFTTGGAHDATYIKMIDYQNDNTANQAHPISAAQNETSKAQNTKADMVPLPATVFSDQSQQATFASTKAQTMFFQPFNSSVQERMLGKYSAEKVVVEEEACDADDPKAGTEACDIDQPATKNAVLKSQTIVNATSNEARAGKGDNVETISNVASYFHGISVCFRNA